MFRDSVARLLRVLSHRVSPASPVYPLEASERERLIIDSAICYSMTNPDRLWSAMKAVEYVSRRRISGAVVECGVWQGGSVIAMISQLMDMGDTEREVWLYDTFEGMTEPTKDDSLARTGASAEEIMRSTPREPGFNVWAISSLEEARANIETVGYPSDRLRWVVGDVSTTLQHYVPDEIAVLRLDTDFYESSRDELEYLYPLISPGGVCIIDDYGFWNGQRKAVDEFLDRLPDKPLMFKVDDGARMWLKI